MQIKIRYENKYESFDIEINEIKGWLNIDLVEGETESDFQERVQNMIDIEFNRPDYNSWHRHNRHIGYSKAIFEDGEDSFGHFKEPLISEVNDPCVFYKDELIKEKIENYNLVCDFIRCVYSNKPELAGIMIKVWLDGFSIREVASSLVTRDKRMSDKEFKHLVANEENKLSKKLNRAKEKFKQVLEKTSDFDIPRGYLIEASKSSKKL